MLKPFFVFDPALSAVDLGFVVSLLGRRSANYPALTSWRVAVSLRPEAELWYKHICSDPALRKHCCVLLFTGRGNSCAAEPVFNTDHNSDRKKAFIYKALKTLLTGVLVTSCKYGNNKGSQLNMYSVTWLMQIVTWPESWEDDNCIKALKQKAC